MASWVASTGTWRKFDATEAEKAAWKLCRACPWCGVPISAEELVAHGHFRDGPHSPLESDWITTCQGCAARLVVRLTGHDAVRGYDDALFSYEVFGLWMVVTIPSSNATWSGGE